jgi:hypothetical protein
VPTRIVFTAPGIKGGVLTQVFAEDPNRVYDAFMQGGAPPFRLTARSRREEVVYVNPSSIAYWTEYTPPSARAGEGSTSDG